MSSHLRVSKLCSVILFLFLIIPFLMYEFAVSVGWDPCYSLDNLRAETPSDAIFAEPSVIFLLMYI